MNESNLERKEYKGQRREEESSADEKREEEMRNLKERKRGSERKQERVCACVRARDNERAS